MACKHWNNKLHSLFTNDIFLQNKDNNNKCIILSRDIPKKENETAKQFRLLNYSSKIIKTLLFENFHGNEVLYESLPRKFYVDLDLKPSSQYYESTSLEDMINTTENIIKKIVLYEFGADLHDKKCLSFVSEFDNDHPKKSIHILFPYIILSGTQLTKYFKTIIQYHLSFDSTLFDQNIKNLMNECLDFAVYGNNQNFRLPFQSKLGKTNRLIPFNICVGQLHIKDLLVGIYTDSANQSCSFNNENIERKANEYLAKIQYKNFPKIKLDTKKEQDYSFIKNNFDILTNLKNYDMSNFKPNYNAPDEITFLISCIPNSSENPQSFHLWWAIGQTLKNIASDGAYDRVTNTKLLNLWVEWSKKASKIYTNEGYQCVKYWQTMKVRNIEQPRFSVGFLKKMASFYHSCYSIDTFHYLKLKSKLFDLDDENFAFDYIHKYNIPNQNQDIIIDRRKSENKPNQQTIVSCIENKKVKILKKKTFEKYCRPLDFDNFDVVVSQAPMGSGKTHQIKESLKKFQFNRIIILSPRQTFAREKAAEFKSISPDFVHYKDKHLKEKKDWISEDKLVVQVESLHHLRKGEVNLQYDLVVLDEIESILTQFSSTTHEDVISSFYIFFNILEKSKHIIMSDAFLTNRTLELCKGIKERRPNLHIKLDMNLFNPNGHITSNILDVSKNIHDIGRAQKKFINHLKSLLQEKKKVCVVVSSKLFKDKIIEEIIQSGVIADNSILSYDRHTSDLDIDDLQNVKSIWNQEQIYLVIYTTKITVGINFDIPNVFDTIMIYGSSYCPIVRDIMQAHFRVRNIKERNIYVVLNCCKACQNFEESIKDYLIHINSHFMNNHNKKNKQSPILNLYMNICEYNALEEYVGTFYYERIFNLFLEKVGYQISYQTENNNESQEKNSKTHFDVFPLGYCFEYCEMRSETDKIIEDMKTRAFRNCASKKDKITLEAFFFFKKCIDGKQALHYNYNQSILTLCEDHINTLDIKLATLEENQLLSKKNLQKKIANYQKQLSFFLKRSNALGMSYSDMYETELFELFTKDNECKRHMLNLIMEFNTSNMSEMIQNTQKKVIKEKENVMRLVHITNICRILELENSTDVCKSITPSHIKKFIEYASLEKNKDLFLLFSMKHYKDKLTFIKAKNALNQIFQWWNGCTIKCNYSERVMTNGKRERTYEYRLAKEQNILLLSVFIDLLIDNRVELTINE